MKLTIDRREWLRGDPLASYLLRSSDKKRCCVGIWLKELGCCDSVLAYVGTAYSVNLDSRNIVDIPGWARVTSDIGLLYATNDSNCITEPERETKIAEIFAKHDVEVEFIN
jgi:hypothetical protein